MRHVNCSLLHATMLALLLGVAPLAPAESAPAPAASQLALHSTEAIGTQTVEYADGDVVLEGYLARPGKTPHDAKLPAVLIVHQWTGVSDHERDVARRLAELGYVALAVDIYGKGVRPTGGDAASKEAGKYRGDRALFRRRLLAGVETIRQQPGVDPDRVAAIGYCFGGTGVLELARTGVDVRGVVSFHGGIDSPTPADGANIKAKVLLLHGASDPFVKPEDIAAVHKELTDHKIDWQMVYYGNQVHSFTDKKAQGNNRLDPVRYDAATDARSWQAMRAFLEEVLAP